MMNKLEGIRKEYHKRLCAEIIRIRKTKKEEYPNFADSNSNTSKQVAWKIVESIGCEKNYESISGQTAGTRFEIETKNYLEKAFNEINHLRPGKWEYSVDSLITKYEQFQHLAYLEKVVQEDKTLASALGTGYIVKPDVVISRML